MIDFTKPVQTREGRAVRILCVDGPGEQPIAGYVAGDNHPSAWSTNGHYYLNQSGPRDSDLVNVAVKRRGWVNLFRDHSDVYVSTVFPDKELALRARTAETIATVELPEWSDSCSILRNQ